MPQGAPSLAGTMRLARGSSALATVLALCLARSALGLFRCQNIVGWLASDLMSSCGVGWMNQPIWREVGKGREGRTIGIVFIEEVGGDLPWSNTLWINMGIPCDGKASNGSSRPSPNKLCSIGELLMFVTISLCGDKAPATAETVLHDDDDARLSMDSSCECFLWYWLSSKSTSEVVLSISPALERSGKARRSWVSLSTTVDSTSSLVLGRPKRLTRSFR